MRFGKTKERADWTKEEKWIWNEHVKEKSIPHYDKENFHLLCAYYGEGNGTPLQYSWLENPMDGGAWWAAVHGVAKSRTRLSGFTFTFHFHALEKEMAIHSSVLAWRIPGMGEPGGLPSMGSHRVGHDWSDLAALLIHSKKCTKQFVSITLFNPHANLVRLAVWETPFYWWEN